MTGIHSESGVRVTCDEQGLDGTWQRIVNGLPHATLAHAPEWQAVIRDAYGHQPLYLIAEDAEGRRGVLPAVFVRRPLLGSVVVSMPFLDGGGPCASSTALARALVERLLKEAFRLKATVVEMRCTEQVDVEMAPMRHKVNLTLPLPADADLLWRQFDGSVRNQVRKAGRSGLTIEFGGSRETGRFSWRVCDAHARARIAGAFESILHRDLPTLRRSGPRGPGAEGNHADCRLGCACLRRCPHCAVGIGAAGVFLPVLEHAALLGDDPDGVPGRVTACSTSADRHAARAPTTSSASGARSRAPCIGTRFRSRLAAESHQVMAQPPRVWSACGSACRYRSRAVSDLTFEST